MMRVEDAERLIGREVYELGFRPYAFALDVPGMTTKTLEELRKKVAKRDSIWEEGYVPLFSVPELARKVLKNNAVVVVHPGFKNYYTEDSVEYMNQFEGYEKYLEDLRAKLQRTHKTVIAYSPLENISQTLATIEPIENPVIFPTNRTQPYVFYDFLRVSETEFFKELIKYIKHVDICGEWNGACVDKAQSELEKNGIDTKVLRKLIFPSDEQRNEWKHKLIQSKEFSGP